MITIALLREEKQPADKRVLLTPSQCLLLKNLYPQINILVQSSPSRCFEDQHYQNIGIEIKEDVSNADFLMGIKEIPSQFLIPNKHYFFFSHTTKKQAHNQEMLKNIITKNITITDYETLRWKNGDRIIGFGRFAGIIGAYNGILAYGKKFKLFELKPAYLCRDFDELKKELKKIKLSNTKIILTGNGRVSLGALELLKITEIRQVSPSDLLTKQFNEAIYSVLLTENLYERTDGKPYDRSDFHHDPSRYRCVFKHYIPYCDLLINGIFWEARMDKLFSVEDIKNQWFNIDVIADISCDINGSVPITYKDTKMEDPIIGFSKQTLQPCLPFSEHSIDIMAVSNLPTELPKDASQQFGEMMIEYILPEMLKSQSDIIDNATICKNGKLSKDYEYLSDYAY